MKYCLFILMMVLLPLSVSAQKDVRKNIRKGNRVYSEQKYSDAASFYENAVEANPSSKEANFNLGNTLYKQKEWDKSIEQFNHFISLEQENPLEAAAGWHNIGNALLQKKELQKSMEAYKMALRLNPQDDETRYNLAAVQKMIQDEEEQQDQGEGEEEQEKEQEQQQDQQPQQQDQQDQEQRAEQPDEPEQMSRDNARQLLQAIEQDEQQTQEKVQQMKAQEREQQAEDNKRKNKNW
ncbi:MAG: tetratricopeptide repeat protein [Bacteroidales bacterium]|jgi:tetratricopeptide (TPR) repeat protein|nr:tetratricopeptide repeat protein [Bacteroidales bacterium]